MKNEQALAAVAFVRTIRYIATSSRTTTITECRAAISALQIVTEEAEFVKQNVDADLTFLLSKLDNALTKIDQRDCPGVIHELAEFKDKVLRLASEEKIDHDDALRLETCANDCMACVEIHRASGYTQTELLSSNNIGYENKET